MFQDSPPDLLKVERMFTFNVNLDFGQWMFTYLSDGGKTKCNLTLQGIPKDFLQRILDVWSQHKFASFTRLTENSLCIQKNYLA